MQQPGLYRPDDGHVVTCKPYGTGKSPRAWVTWREDKETTPYAKRDLWVYSLQELERLVRVVALLCGFVPEPVPAEHGSHAFVLRRLSPRRHSSGSFPGMAIGCRLGLHVAFRNGVAQLQVYGIEDGRHYAIDGAQPIIRLCWRQQTERNFIEALEVLLPVFMPRITLQRRLHATTVDFGGGAMLYHCS